MKSRFFAILLLLNALAAEGEIHYFAGDSVSTLPAGIAAVEARACNKTGAWVLTWPGAVISVDAAMSNFVDGVDEPLARIRCGNKEVTAKGFECFGGYNTIAVEWSADGMAHILGGADVLTPVMDLDSLPGPQGYVKVAYAKGIADIIIETNPDNFDRLMTAYTDEELDAAKKWRYLDRESDPKIALLGGQYVLAQIGNDLIYMSGAKTNASHWRKGMLKGRMTPTGYTGYYRLQWYDATGRALPDESFVQTDDKDSTMSATFPGLQTTLRFTSLADGGVAVGGK